MLTHVVERMTTKEDVAKLDTRIDDLRTEIIDRFEDAHTQFRTTHDRLRDIGAEITVIHRRVERLEELGASNPGSSASRRRLRREAGSGVALSAVMGRDLFDQIDNAAPEFWLFDPREVFYER
jgi:hypothetical protein